MSAPDKIWIYPEQGDPGAGEWFWSAEVDEPEASAAIGYTRTDLSQAAVAAALEAAAGVCIERRQGWLAPYIRALITPDQRTALSAHVAAEVADARLEMINSLKDEIARQEGQGGEGSSLWCVIDGERTIHEIHAQERMDARVRAEVAKTRAEDAAWLPVEDAPQDGTAVITIKSNGDVAKGAWYKNPFGDENTFIDRASGKWWTAVGWLPMPKSTQIGAKS